MSTLTKAPIRKVIVLFLFLLGIAIPVGAEDTTSTTKTAPGGGAIDEIKKIDNVESDFQRSAQVKLSEWDRKLSDLKKEADATSGEKKAQLQRTIATLETHHLKARSELDAVASGGIKLEDARESIEKHFAEMNAAYEKAHVAE